MPETILFQDGDCSTSYGFREAQFRALNSDGSVDEDGEWYATDCPVDFSMDPDITAGKKEELKCGDKLKMTVQPNDQQSGLKVKFSMGCRNPEVENIISGSVGTVEYNGDSPPLAIGFTPPTLEEQEDAYPFEMRIYRALHDGDSVVAFEETHLYYCKPNFAAIAGKQEAFGTIEWELTVVENPVYDLEGAKPPYSYTQVEDIPV